MTDIFSPIYISVTVHCTRKELKDEKTSGFNVKTISVGLLAAFSVTGLESEEWSEICGETTLRKLVSGATASIEVSPGVIATGKYLSDGRSMDRQHLLTITKHVTTITV